MFLRSDRFWRDQNTNQKLEKLLDQKGSTMTPLPGLQIYILWLCITLTFDLLTREVAITLWTTSAYLHQFVFKTSCSQVW